MKKLVITGVIVLLLLLLLLLVITISITPKPAIKEKYLLISIHDVTPFYETQINEILSELEKRDINNFTLVITPNWNNEYDIKNYPQFTKKLLDLKENGAELGLHGYDHKGMKLEEKSVLPKLDKAITSFEENFHFAPKVFIPPIWNQNKALYDALKEKRFLSTETTWKLEYFSGKVYKGFPLGMESYSSNKYFRYDIFSPVLTKYFSNLYARLFWNKGGVIRYTFHPREVDNRNFEATFDLLEGFLERDWKPVTYSYLIMIEN